MLGIKISNYPLLQALLKLQILSTDSLRGVSARARYNNIHHSINSLRTLFPTLCLSIFLVGCGGGGKGGDESPPINQPPSVSAGIDQVVPTYLTVTLSGSGSDNDGSISRYSWTQTSGTTVTLDNPNSAITSFQTPEINQDETLTFELVARDNEGATSKDSVSITVMLVEQPNTFMLYIQFYDTDTVSSSPDYATFKRDFNNSNAANTSVSEAPSQVNFEPYCWSYNQANLPEESGCRAQAQGYSGYHRIQSSFVVSKQGHFQETLDLYTSGGGWLPHDFLSNVYLSTRDYIEAPEVTTEQNARYFLVRLCVEVNTGEIKVDNETGILSSVNHELTEILKDTSELLCLE
jgi:hypothetical protein